MDSVPGATRPESLGRGFAFVFAGASLWQRYHGPTLMHITSRIGLTGLAISSGGQGGAVA